MPTDPLARRFAEYRTSHAPEILAELFEATAPSLRARARQATPDRGLADDLVHDTWVTAIETAFRFDARRVLLSWLFGILDRKIRRARNGRGRHEPSRERPERAPETPFEASERNEARLVIDAAIRSLAEPYRTVLILRFSDGMSTPRIAAALGRPEGTVRSQLCRGTALLKKLLPPGLAALAAVLLVARDGLASPGRKSPQSSTGSAFRVLALAGICAVAFLLPEFDQPGPVGGAAASAAVVPDAPVRKPREVSPLRSLTGLRDGHGPARGSIQLDLTWSDTGAPASNVGAKVLRNHGGSAVLDAVRCASDRDGSIVFDDVPCGVVRVYFDRGQETDVAVTRGRRSRVRFVLAPGITVAGVVVDSRGRPVPEAAILVNDNPGYPWEGGVVGFTAESGRFRLRGLAAGSSLCARARGFAPSPLCTLPSDAGNFERVCIRLTEPGGAVTGSVIDPRGQAVAGAKVIVGDCVWTKRVRYGDAIDWRTFPHYLRTDSGGLFAAEGVEAGAVPVLVRAPGFAPFSRYVRVRPGKSSEVTVRLAPGCMLSGVVKDAGGRPIESALVRIEGRGWHQRASAYTAPDGRFHIDGLAPERIEVEVRKSGFVCSRKLFVDVGPTRLVWDPVLVERPILAGRLVDERERALAGWTVRTDESGQTLAMTRPSGRFTITVASRDRTALWLKEPGSRVWIRHSDLTAPDLARGELVVRVAHELRATASISGTLVSASGIPPVDTWIRIEHEGETDWVPQRVGPSGEFRVGPLPAGCYRLSTQSLDPALPPADLGRYVLEADETKTLGRLAPKPGGSLVYEFRRRDGKGVRGIFAEILDADQHAVCYLRSEPAGRGIQALEAGSYEVRARARGSRVLDPVRFTIRPGEETRLAIDLEPTRTCHLRFAWPVAATSLRYAVRRCGRVVQRGVLEAPSFDVASLVCDLPSGRQVLELTSEPGGRWAGEFVVADLLPSHLPIDVSLR